MINKSDPQTVVSELPQGRVVCMDSAYDVDQRNRDRDVVVTASYCGVLCARFASAHNPKGVIGVDCGIGLEGSAIAGLWFYEALNMPAAAVDVTTVELGNGLDVYERGIISRHNDPALRCGVQEGMPVADAVTLILDQNDLTIPEPAAITNRTVVHETETGSIVCTDSIAFALPEDRDRNVLCTGGHTGRSAVPYLRTARPRGFICSDGGIGRVQSGIAGLTIVEREGLAGAAVDVKTARMGDGLSTYKDGVISFINKPAVERGVRIGMKAREAAERLLLGDPATS
ncbi:MAG: hypothetical protein OES46_21705 [Gammaproteobacteria bacterium]|nr:hypothetical protein [Gammaproteobacteria bacterium]